MNHDHDHCDDATLVALVLAGDREVFTPLVRRYYPSVLRLCIRLLGPSLEAQDIAQEATLHTFLGLARLQDPARFGAWFHAIAANLARSALRRRQPLSLDALGSNTAQVIRRSFDLPSVDEIAASREVHDAIVTAINELSVVNRAVVIGFYLAGYTYDELATLLGVPVSTVKSRLFKGRRQLRHILQPFVDRQLLPETSTRKERAVTPPELIAVQVETIYEYPLTQRSIVVLSSSQGDRYLPIRMYMDEAVAIEHALKGRQAAPATTFQDTMLQLIALLGGRVEQIVIQSLAEQTYYATIVLAQGTQYHELNVRLGDALALAARTQTPLYATATVFDEAGIALDIVATDPAVAVAELPAAQEPATTSDQWPRMFIEHVWSFLLGVLHGVRTPLDGAKLRDIVWDDRFLSQEVEWDGQAMQAVRLPTGEEAWLVVRPELWTQLRRFVGWVQRRDLPQRVESLPVFTPLSADLQRQMDAYVANALADLAGVGARMAALIHLSGRLVAWKSADTYEDTVRMGRAAVKDYLLGRRFVSLVGIEEEPGITLTFERDTAVNPAMAAGANVKWTNETLINDQWVFVVGFTTDQWHEEAQQQFTHIEHQLAALLPRPSTCPLS